MFPNIGIVALAALVPMVMGFLYYNPKVMGTVWMKVSGMTEEKIKEGNMGLIFGVAYLMSFIMAFMLSMLVVHQTDFHSVLIAESGYGVVGSELMNYVNEFMTKYGHLYMSFGHGALHGGMIGFFIGLPILMTNGLFEGKSLKYGFVNALYWISTMTLMGGVLCAWAF